MLLCQRNNLNSLNIYKTRHLKVTGRFDVFNAADIYLLTDIKQKKSVNKEYIT